MVPLVDWRDELCSRINWDVAVQKEEEEVEDEVVGVTETLRRFPYLHVQMGLTLLKTSCDS